MSHFAAAGSAHSHVTLPPILVPPAGGSHHHHPLEATQDDEEEVVASSEHHRTVDEQHHGEVLHPSHPDARALQDVQAFYVEHLTPGATNQHADLGAMEGVEHQHTGEHSGDDTKAHAHDGQHGGGDAAHQEESLRQHHARHLGTNTTPMSSNPQLREREEILRMCYKTWFRVKPGAREIKDRFWALYYRKLQNKYVMRDNLVGRKISEWISEDLDLLASSDPAKAQLLAQFEDTPKPGPKPKLDPDKQRRRATGAKEAGYAAYLHVELVSPTGAELAEAHKALVPFLVDGAATSIEFSRDALDDEVAWFRANRDTLMSNIPSIGNRRSRARSSSPTRAALGLPQVPAPSPAAGSGKKVKLQHGQQHPHAHSQQQNENITISHNPDPAPLAYAPAPASVAPTAAANGTVHGHGRKASASGVEVECDKDWVRCDVQRMQQADGEALVVRVDLPGLLPGESELQVQTDGGNKLLVKGDRHSSVPADQLLHAGRAAGPFSLLVTLPFAADSTAKWEQTYSYGVLTIKIPFPHPMGWRSLDVLNLGT